MTPTTEVRYGEPVDALREPWNNTGPLAAEIEHLYDNAIDEGAIFPERLILDSLVRIRVAIEATLLRVRFAYEDCPEGCEGGRIYSEAGSPAMHWQDGDRFYKDCPRCFGSDLWNIPKGTVRLGCAACNHLEVIPCPGEAGRCFEGYAVEVAP